MRNRDTNRTVTLIVCIHPKYSNRKVTAQTPQLEPSHPVDSSARVKSPSRQFKSFCSPIVKTKIQVKPQKHVIEIQKQPNCKKKVWPCSKWPMKKAVKSKGAAKKWL